MPGDRLPRKAGVAQAVWQRGRRTSSGKEEKKKTQNDDGREGWPLREEAGEVGGETGNRWSKRKTQTVSARKGKVGERAEDK